MIESERLILVPVNIEMLDSLIESDEAFRKKYGYVNDGGEYLKPSPFYLYKIRARLLINPNEYPLAVDRLIILKSVNSVIGTIYFKKLPHKGVTEVGYGMNLKYEGNGYMTEALKLLLEYGKENGVKTVLADTTKGNLRSQKVLLRNGFSLLKEEDNILYFSKDL